MVNCILVGASVLSCPKSRLAAGEHIGSPLRLASRYLAFPSGGRWHCVAMTDEVSTVTIDYK